MWGCWTESVSDPVETFNFGKTYGRGVDVDKSSHLMLKGMRHGLVALVYNL